MDLASSASRDALAFRKRLRILSNATHAFAEASQSTCALFEAVVREVAENMDCSCALSLIASDGIHFTTPHVHASDPELARVLQALTQRGQLRIDAHPSLAHVVETRTPFFMPSVDLDEIRSSSPPGAHQLALDMDVRSALVVPLLERQQVIGTLSLARHGAGKSSLDEDDLTLAQSLAQHAALVLATARLVEQAAFDAVERERNATRLRLLADAAHDFSEATGDYDRLLGVIARRVGESLGDLCAIRGVSEDGVWLELGQVYHRDAETADWIRRLSASQPQRVGEGITGKVAASREALFMPALAEHEFAASAPPEYREFLERLDVRSVLAVPMICRDQVVGVAMLLRSGSGNPYAENDLHLVRSVVHHAAIAIANARSYAAERAARAAAVSANAELHRSEQAHRLLFDANPMPLVVFDAASLETLAVNDAALKLYGYTREEFRREKVSVLSDEGEDSVKARVAAMPDAELSGVARHRRKDGALVVAEFTTRPLSFAGKKARISVLHDITARAQAEQALRRTEEQLRQAQKMDAVGRLAGGIAHDFNNMLSVILSYADLIASDLSPNDPAKADVAQIRKAAMSAADLTRQLLVFSRQQVLAPQTLDLNELLAKMDKMLRRILGEDIDLVSSFAVELGRALVDPNSVEQVVMNLAVNARDAMPRGGKLTIETANVDLDEDYARGHLGSKAGPHVLLAVSDTGVGMDSTTQARIFEPFFTTKEVGKGTGLGLSIVFGVAQQSGGSVWVYSELGKGTTFKVYFPRVASEPERAPSPSGPPAASLRGCETILLVEDQAQVRTVACDILRRHGYRVLVAQSAGEALLICESQAATIDLLLTDIVMPHLSGAELAKRLSVMRPEIKVLCMSGYTDDSVVRHGVLESGVAFLQKPFTPESLTRKVREVLNASQA
jgi:PAS domain S-box-containing protein